MLTLVIDTASARGLVALADDDSVLAERAWRLETTYSQELLRHVDALLAEAGVPRTGIEDVVVNVGPGGYGSLRVGVATAQGLALGLGVPLAGVGRLEADAAPHVEAGRAVVAVHDAGSIGVAWAVYERGPDGLPRELEPARAGGVDECVTAAPRGALWCGEVNDDLGHALERAGVAWSPVAEEHNHRRAGDFVRLARAHAAFGDPARVDVVYLRPPAITHPRE